MHTGYIYRKVYIGLAYLLACMYAALTFMHACILVDVHR